MGRGCGKKRYASLWCMRTKRHLVVPLTTIKNVKHREIGKVFNYNKVETKLIDIGEDEKELQRKAIDEENVLSAIEQAKKKSEEQTIPDKVDDQKEKSAVLNSNKRKIDEKIGLDNNIFECNKRIKLVSTASNLCVNQGITLKNTDASPTSSDTPSVTIQQQQHTSPPLTKTPSQLINDLPAIIDSPPKRKNESLIESIDKDSVIEIDLDLPPKQPTIDPVQQQLFKNNVNPPEYHHHAQPVPPKSTNVPPFQHSSPFTTIFYPRLSTEEPYVLTNLDTQKQTPTTVSDVPVTDERFYSQATTRPESGNGMMSCKYTSPPMTTHCSRAYESELLGSDFNGSAAFQEANNDASMTQICHENLQKKIYNEPPGHLSQQLTPCHESAAPHSIEQQVSTTTLKKNLPNDTVDPLASTSFKNQPNIRIEAPGTLKPHPQSVNSQTATMNDEASATEKNTKRFLFTTSESPSDDSREDEEQENLPEVMELIAMMSRGQITERDVWMQKQIYLSFKSAYQRQQQTSKIVENGYKVPETFLKAGDEKVEIYPQCGFYLPKNVKTLIDFKYEEENSWDVIVKEVILAVYGEDIIHFSVTGKGPNSRPKINPNLFKGLLGWINHGKVGEKLVGKKELIKEINHISSNKRGYQKRKQAKK